jgi:hypothetical protein
MAGPWTRFTNADKSCGTVIVRRRARRAERVTGVWPSITFAKHTRQVEQDESGHHHSPSDRSHKGKASGLRPVCRDFRRPYPVNDALPTQGLVGCLGEIL